MDDAHLWSALRYTERNPVRAGMVRDRDGVSVVAARASTPAAAGTG